MIKGRAMAEKPGPHGRGRERPDGPRRVAGGKLHGGQRARPKAPDCHGADSGGIGGEGRGSIRLRQWM